MGGMICKRPLLFLLFLKCISVRKTINKKDSNPCVCCHKRLNPSNAARNFDSPALSVKVALEHGILREDQKILEIGSGNLRNSRFILKRIPKVKISCFELETTIERFHDGYKKFCMMGGRVLKNLFNCKEKYDIIICTFVLETICPESRRMAILRLIKKSIKKNGVFIASFRGYSGVRGNNYKQCPLNQGLITPLHTFIKPYSIQELNEFLDKVRFNFLLPLQKYRVNKPQNIHIIAFPEVSNGKRLAEDFLF